MPNHRYAESDWSHFHVSYFTNEASFLALWRTTHTHTHVHTDTRTGFHARAHTTTHLLPPILPYAKQVPNHRYAESILQDDWGHFHVSYFTNEVSLHIAMTRAGLCRVYLGFVRNGWVTGEAVEEFEDSDETRTPKIRAMRAIYQKCMQTPK